MKRARIISVLMIVWLCGCSGNEKAEKKSAVQESSSAQKTKAQPVLMTGEPDKFNQGNNIESIRKTKLTNFGRLTSPPKFLTPDSKAIQKALAKPGFFTLRVINFYSKPIETPSYPFDYENDIDALKRLYSSHKLNELFTEKMPALQMLRLLMKYTYTFMEGGSIPSPADDIGPSAEIITKLRREKGIGGSSKHYAALFCQLSLSCGYNARMVSMHTIGEKGELLTHDVCEIFLDDYEKWAVFDPYHYATYFVRDNIPQSALEIRDIMLSNNYKVLQPLSEILDFTDVVSLCEKIIPRYRYIYMWRMNDILSKSPKGGSISWQALYRYHLVWEDEKTPVSEGGFDKLDKFTDMKDPDFPLKGVRYVTHNWNDFYWLLNRVHINLERRAEDDVYLYFDTLTPNFKKFELFDQGLKWQTGNVYELLNYALEFKVRSVNMFGMYGHSSNMMLTLQ